MGSPAREAFCILLVLGADINPNVLKLRDLVAFLSRQQMRRFSRYHPGHRTGSRPHGQALAEQYLHIPAADGLHVEKPVFVHMLHHQADLVAVPGKHDSRLTLGVADCNHIAVPIGAHVIGVFMRPGSNNILYGPFEAGRARGFEKAFEKGVRTVAL